MRRGSLSSEETVLKVQAYNGGIVRVINGSKSNTVNQLLLHGLDLRNDSNSKFSGVFLRVEYQDRIASEKSL